MPSPLIPINDPQGLVVLYRVDGIPDLFLAVTEFNLQCSLSWYEVKPAKRAEVLAGIDDRAFLDRFQAHRSTYATSMAKTWNLRRTGPDLHLVIDLP